MLAKALVVFVCGVLPSLQDGIRLYDNLQFERAIAALKRAETEATTLEDRVAVQLYTGLTQAELGRMPQAEAAFRNALVLDPSAKLPVKTSPKIEASFNKLKAKFAGAAALQAPRPVLGGAGAPKPDPVAATPPATDAPLAAREKAPLGTAPGASSSAEVPLAPEVPAPSSVRVRPLLLGGGALGVLGGAIAFGLASQSSTRAAESERVQVASAEHADSARTLALTSNVMYGAAATLALAAALDYLLFPETEATAP